MLKDDVVKKIDANVQGIENLVQQKLSIWIDYIVFTWQWWFLVIVTILPWIFWVVFRKKSSTDRLLFVGLFVISISSLFDILGSQLGFWHYRYEVLPLIPSYFPWDFTLMPVTILFLLQIKPKTNPWIKAIIFASITSFIAEPLVEYLQIYEPKKWKFIYSFPIQICVYLSSHYISKRNNFSPVY
jgi:hypothetical protein